NTASTSVVASPGHTHLRQFDMPGSPRKRCSPAHRPRACPRQPLPATTADPTRECDKTVGRGAFPDRIIRVNCGSGKADRQKASCLRTGEKNARRISPPGTNPNLSAGLVEVGL